MNTIGGAVIERNKNIVGRFLKNMTQCVGDDFTHESLLLDVSTGLLITISSDAGFRTASLGDQITLLANYCRDGQGVADLNQDDWMVNMAANIDRLMAGNEKSCTRGLKAGDIMPWEPRPQLGNRWGRNYIPARQRRNFPARA